MRSTFNGLFVASVIAVILGIVFFSGLPTFSFTANAANKQVKAQAAGWCAFSNQHLTKGGKTVKCEQLASPRCIMMNNYWCLAQNARNPWNGTPTLKGGNGNSDGHHAIFSDPKWAARAIAIDLRSKYKAGFKTAWQIADRYSPACDTLGTVGVLQGVGRSCSTGPQPPAYFKGPKCPAAPKTQSQCVAQCNCPPKIAKQIAEGTGMGVNSDLRLFDATGAPTVRLPLVIQNLGRQEIGMTISPDLVKMGVEMAKPIATTAVVKSQVVSSKQKGQCVQSAPWEMGDSTENTFGGSISPTTDGYTLQMPPAERDYEGALVNAGGSRFWISSSAKLPAGKFKIEYTYSYSSADPVEIIQHVSARSARTSLDDKYAGKTVLNPAPGQVTVALSGEFISHLSVRVSKLSFCPIL